MKYSWSERSRLSKLLARERRLWRSGLQHIAGVDEAGRGPLAGPVVAAAVIFPKDVWIAGIDDSKKLSPRKREKLFSEIQAKALCVGIGVIDQREIDAINIREASLLAMQKAIAQLLPQPEYLLVDGNYFRKEGISARTVIHGDAKSFSIAAASIVAKVTRDRLMQVFHGRYPLYGFDRHKGYATRDHIRAIEKFGRCDIHRQSFHVRRLET